MRRRRRTSAAFWRQHPVKPGNLPASSQDLIVCSPVSGHLSPQYSRPILTIWSLLLLLPIKAYAIGNRAQLMHSSHWSARSIPIYAFDKQTTVEIIIFVVSQPSKGRLGRMFIYRVKGFQILLLLRNRVFPNQKYYYYYYIFTIEL